MKFLYFLIAFMILFLLIGSFYNIIISFLAITIIGMFLSLCLFNIIWPIDHLILNSIKNLDNIKSEKKKIICEFILLPYYLGPFLLIGSILSEIIIIHNLDMNLLWMDDIIKIIDIIILIITTVTIISQIIIRSTIFILNNTSIRALQIKAFLFLFISLLSLFYYINIYVPKTHEKNMDEINNALSYIYCDVYPNGKKVYKSWKNGDIPPKGNSFHYSFEVENGVIHEINIDITSDAIDRIYNYHAMWTQMQFTGYDENSIKNVWTFSDDNWKYKIINRDKDGYMTWRGKLSDIYQGIDIIAHCKYGSFKAGGRHINSYSTSFNVDPSDIERMKSILYLESLFQKTDFKLK